MEDALRIVKTTKITKMLLETKPLNTETFEAVDRLSGTELKTLVKLYLIEKNALR